MTCDEAAAFLFGLIDYEKTPAQIAVQRYLNLDRMREALARAGNPHAGLRCAHIAGTKGKGSTAAILARMLRAGGLRVGLYTSPHLVSFRERVRVDGELIGKAELAALVEEIRPVIEGMSECPPGAPTFFEAATLLAMLYFRRRQVDVAVLETGMGGRLDATNVARPLATAVTTVAFDHMVELGDTLELIATEKAGIVKPGVPVISAPQHPAAAAVIARRAAEQGSPLYRVGAEIRCLTLPSAERENRFTVSGRLGEYAAMRCPLLGEHQMINAAVAVGLAECLAEAGALASGPALESAIRAGIAGVEWPGRLQALGDRPLLILDGAHDRASVAALLAALDRHFPGLPRRFILGFSREKEWAEMLRQLASHARALMLTAAENPRAVPPAQLAEAASALGAPHQTAPDVATALRETLARAREDELICVTGSLFVVGEALKAAAVAPSL